MATSGLNYLISVQLDELQGLKKLHDTIVGIQQLSEKGADFNVRVNAASLNALTKDIADSVSSGFSRAKVGGRTTSGDAAGGGTVTLDTAKLEETINRLAQVVDRMGLGGGGGGGGGTAPAASTSRRRTRVQDEVLKLERTLSVFDEVLAGKAKAAEEFNQVLNKHVKDPSNSSADVKNQLLAAKQRLEGRIAQSSQAPGLAVDASVLKRVFESGALQMSDALRKGIVEATEGLSKAITTAILAGFPKSPERNWYNEGHPSRDVDMEPLEKLQSQMQREQMRRVLETAPDSHQAQAYRAAAKYVAGVSTRDREMLSAAAAGGVMPLPEQYRPLMVKRVSNSGEVKYIEEEIAKLTKRRMEAEQELKAATTDKDRERFGSAVGGIQAEIDAQRLKQNGAIFAQVNKQIESAGIQYQAFLADQRGKNLITPDEYTKKLGSLKYSMQRVSELRDNNPNIEREMLLLPDALAQWVRDTMKSYVAQVKRLRDTGQTIDQDLVDRIRSNVFMNDIAGRIPTTQAQAAKIVPDSGESELDSWVRQFNRAKTAYESVRRRATIGLPTFNPNLSISTAPFPAGQEDPGMLAPEDRERYLRTFIARGGAFASQTEERRRYAEKELAKMLEQERQGNLGEAGQKRLLEYQREMEFGGRYYYKDSPMARGIMENGALMTAQEAARVRNGGARSAKVGGSLAPVEEAMSSEAKAAQDLYRAMGHVETALQRVTRAVAEMGKANFDPMIKQFKALADAVAPYAANLEKVARAVDVNFAAKRAADAKTKQEAIEQAKTAGLADRYALAQSLGISVGTPAFNVPGVGRQSTGQIPLISQDAETLRAMVARGGKQIAALQARSQDLLSLEAAQLAAGLPSAGTARAIGATSAKYNATLGTFATNAAALAQQDPRFFGGQSQNVIGAAQGLLGAQGKTITLGDEIRVLATSLEQFKAIGQELKRLDGNKSDAANLRRQSLTGVRDQLIEGRNASLDRLMSAGVLEPGQANSNTAKVLEVLKGKQRELNAEVAKYSDQLLKAAESSVKAEIGGGNFLDRVISKFKNLSAYLFAGGLLYTITSELKQASAAAISLEGDIARIQGVLSSRSSGQAGIIAQGVMGGAMEYGTDLRTSVQSAKIFSQTGASPAQTVELTRAALAAQVGAGLEAGQATELLIAVENITNRQVKAFDILDRISRIESQYAVSAQDLSNAIQRAGSLATQLQPQALGAVDALDLIIGSATTIIERTRVSGEQAATSLRFIISRLAAPEVSRSLQERFNIKLAGDNPNTLRPLQDILKDIADRYRELRANGQTVQAQQLLTTFAGARQSNVAAALLEGFDDALRVASESALAYGDTQERVKIQLDTMQAKFAQFNTAFVGFASSVFNDTGLGWMLKRTLEVGTKILGGAQSAGGAIGIGAGLLGGGLAARAAGTGLLSLATRPGVSALTTVLSGGASTMVGGLATGGVFLGGFLAAVGALELIAKTLQKRSEREEVRTAERFDREEFRKSDFYQAFREQSIGFGMNPDDMAAAFRSALTTADTTVQEEIRTGRLAPNQAFNRTTGLLVDILDKTIPGFSSIGTEAERTAKALELLRESAKYSAAIPNTYTNEFIKDLENLTSEFDKNSPKLGEAIRGMVKYGLGTFTAVRSFDFESLNKQFSYRGRQFLDVPNLTASGTGMTFAQLAAKNPGKEIETLDTYARDFLLVTSQARNQLLTVEADLRRRNENITPLSVQGVLNADTKLSDAARRDLGTAYFRLGNQRDLAGQIAQSLDVALGNGDDQRLTQLKKDLGGTSSEPGEVFARAFRQAIEEARRQMIDAAKAANMSAAGIDKLNAEFDRMNSSASRAAKSANLAVTAINVRDRLFEPIVGYGSRMAEIGTRQRIASRFGMNYDSVAAESQAAQELLVGLDQVPIRLLQDRIRESARLVSAGTGSTTREVVVAEDGGAVGGKGPVQFSESSMINGLLLGRSEDIRKVNTLRDNYVKATTEGLASFVDRGLASGNKDLRSVAENLRDALSALGNFGKIKTKEDLLELARLEGNLEEQRQKAIEVVGKQIEAEMARTVRLRENAREAAGTSLGIQLSGSRQQSLLQARVAELQANPLAGRQALDTQLELLSAQRDLRIALAEATKAATIQNLMEQPDSKERQQSLLDAQAAFDREAASAQNDQALAAYAQAAQLDTQLRRRRREEGMQLTQDLTNPLAELLQSSKNFSREGYERAFSGMAQAAQRRMVDMFMRQMFSETGKLGDTLAKAFESGGTSTETKIDRAFRIGAEAAAAKLREALGTAGPAVTAGAVGRPTPTSSGVYTVEDYVATFMPDTRLGDLSDDQRASIEQWIAAGGALTAGGAAAMAQSKYTPEQLASITNANIIDKPTTNWKDVGKSAMPMVGSLLGGAINTGVKNSSAGEGAAMGAMIGNMIVPGLGGLAGGLLGGLFGSRIGKDTPEADQQFSALQKIEQNTRQQIEAIENQTRMLTLDSRFMNVPTGFTVPGFRPFGVGGGGGGTANITVNVDASGSGSDAQSIGDAVASAIANQLRGMGTSFDVRFA